MFCNCTKNITKHEKGVWITMSKEKALVKRPGLQIRGVQGTGSMLDGLGTKGATPHQRHCSRSDMEKEKGKEPF